MACPVVKETKEFMSTNTKKTYRIRQHIDCNSSCVVYLATCLRCQGQYVGKSVTTFKLHHRNDKQEIKHKRGGIWKHFGEDRACTCTYIMFMATWSCWAGGSSGGNTNLGHLKRMVEMPCASGRILVSEFYFYCFFTSQVHWSSPTYAWVWNRLFSCYVLSMFIYFF